MKAGPLVTLLVLIAMLLTGCTASHGVQDLPLNKEYRGAGRLLTNPTFDGTGAPVIYWLDSSKTTVSLTTWDSGSCPNIPIGIRMVSSVGVSLTMKSYTGACTSDLGPYTSEFAIPSTVSRSKPVVVTLEKPGSSDPQQAMLNPSTGLDAPTS